MRISTIRHPDYTDNEHDFQKWRLCYKGGRPFIDRYLVKFSRREDQSAFEDRRRLSYNPAFAKAGIDKLKNTFYSRMSEIVRIGGDKSYQDAVKGINGGVDLFGCSMNSYMGQTILPELMTMRRVGIFIDKPNLDGNLLANNKDKRPYVYHYNAEDILTWSYLYVNGEYIYTNVLLRDTNFVQDDQTGLVKGIFDTFRHVWLSQEDGKVHIQLYKVSDDPKAEMDTPIGEEVILNLPRIPFVILELKESLLADVADYQIGMLNIASADMNYCFKANFPFYIEQYDSAAESAYLRGPLPGPKGTASTTTGQNSADGTQQQAQKSSDDKEVKTGAVQGRKYPKGLNPPDFIAPPTEPLLASIKKQEQMKQEIYELIDIAGSNIQATHASAESKQMDDRGLESGLSYLGLELEYGEREIGKIWALYQSTEEPTINYPSKYSLKSDAERTTESTTLSALKSAAPSATFSKEISKRISRTMLQEKVTPATLDKIDKEIDTASFVTSDPTTIEMAVTNGLVSNETASNALGFNGAKEIPVAKQEHAQRLAEIAAAQSNGAARGVPDQSGSTADANVEKTGKQGRGPAK